MATRYQRALRKTANATGLPYRTVQEIYKGRVDALYRTAESGVNPRRSLPAFRYAKRIREIQETNNVSRRMAQTMFRTVEQIRPTRLKPFTFDANNPPEALRGLDWRGKEVELKKGKNAGKVRVFVDTVNKEVLGSEAFDKLRVNVRVERLAQGMRSSKWGKYRRLHKYFTPAELKAIRARKNKQPTLAEARKAAKRMVRDVGRNQKLFEYVRESLGYV